MCSYSFLNQFFLTCGINFGDFANHLFFHLNYIVLDTTNNVKNFTRRY